MKTMDKFDEMRSSISGSPDMVASFIHIVNRSEQTEKEWIAKLRELGFKASHPNDGWVDRENDSIHFAYPQFNDNAGVGDLVMLGWPSDKPCDLRPVRLIGETENSIIHRYFFKDEPTSL